MMLKTVVVAAVIAAATSEETIKDAHDGLHELQKMQMGMHKSGASILGASMHLGALMNSTTDIVKSAAVSLSTIKSANDELTQKKGELQSAYDALKVSNVVDDWEAKGEDFTSGIQTSVDGGVSTVEKSLSDFQGAADSLVSTPVAAWKKANIDAALNSKMPVRRHLFAGRSRTWGDRGGWKDFIVNQVQCDTAKPMFQLRTSTRFRALKVGVYHIMWWAIQHGGRCHGHNRIRYDGGAWLYQHNHNWLTDGAWEGNQLDLYWKFNANKDFWTTHSNGCGHRWHISPSNLDDGNSYNRIFVEYVGQVLDDKGNQVRWNGPQ